MNNIHSVDEIRNIIKDYFDHYYPKMRYTKDDAQSIPDSTFTKIEYNDKDYDTLNCYNTTSFRFIALYTGWYHVNASLMLADTAWTAGQIFLIALYLNDVIHSYGFREEFDANITKHAHSILSNDIYLEKNDYINIKAYQNSGGAINTRTYLTLNYFSVHRI